MCSKYLGVTGVEPPRLCPWGGILSEPTAGLSRVESREGRGASRRVSTISPFLDSKRTRVPCLIWNMARIFFGMTTWPLTPTMEDSIYPIAQAPGTLTETVQMMATCSSGTRYGFSPLAG